MMKTKENTGITLVALIVTIIVLLILAAVSMKLIGGSEGILGKASNAIDKYKIAKKQEKDALDEYENAILSKYSGNVASNNNGGVVTTRQIDEEEYNNLRETVGIQQNVINDQQSRIDIQQNTINTLGSTVSALTNTVSGLQSQMTSLSSSSGGVNMNKPTTWEVGHEYDFGNGLYGQKFTGRITVDPYTIDTQDLILSSEPRILNKGGWFLFGQNNAGDDIYMTVADEYQNSGYSIEIMRYGNILKINTISPKQRSSAPYDLWILYTK